MVTVKSSEEKKEYYSLQSRERVVLQRPRWKGEKGEQQMVKSSEEKKGAREVK